MMKKKNQYKVLLVDDAEANIHTLANSLYDEYDLYAVRDGESAIEHARTHSPDIILLDIVMPGTDGFEVCRVLKRNRNTKDIPIIFLTALDSLKDKTSGFEAGAVDYITKPFDPFEVRARVKVHLDLKHSHEELKNVNKRLRKEVTERRDAQKALQNARDELEQRVRERTAELEETNKQLCREIDEHKASEERYRFLTENVDDGVFILQKKKILFVNPAFVKIFRYPEEQIIGRRPVLLIHNEHKKFFKGMCKDAYNGAEFRDFQLPCIRKDGQGIWVEGHYNTIQWEGVPAILGTVRDITRRKLREIAGAEERARLLKELEGLRAGVRTSYKLGDIVGKSPAIRNIYEIITNISATDEEVIIYGESGTGKELIARTIHSISGRRNNAFVPVNCGAIPETLFESEFFGYCKGAFTGANSDKPGLFDFANHGTLFLDEVGELTPNMQVKLLRAIEDKEYTPVGSPEVRHTDVRIISATNRDLTEALKKGEIREDFFYRIHVIPVYAPPLRDRKEDIPLLVEHFLELYGTEKNIRTLPASISEALYKHFWPGNVRELKNVLKRYLTLNYLDFTPVFASEDHNKTFSDNISRKGILLRDAVAAFEKKLISDALKRNYGNRTRTAQMLGMNERTFYRKLKRYLLI